MSPANFSTGWVRRYLRPARPGSAPDDRPGLPADPGRARGGAAQPVHSDAVDPDRVPGAGRGADPTARDASGGPLADRS